LSLAWWNGREMPAASVRLSPADAGFRFGDGLFETLRVDGGRARDVAAHLDRLLAGLPRIGIELPEDRAALERAVGAVAAAAPRPTARLRITVTRGAGGEPTRLIETAPYAPPDERAYRTGVAAVFDREARVDSRSPLAGLKSLSCQANRLALSRAEAAGAWEALLANERGRLAEGSRTNLALVLDGGIWTPPLEDGCLPGTVRRRLLEQGAIAERPLAAGDLSRTEGILLMNSLAGVLPVGRMDGRELRAGPEAERLRALLR
jgi:branched-chain amino acid aminotransferase